MEYADIVKVGPYQPTPIMLQSVANDGHTLQGSPTTMLNNNGMISPSVWLASVLTVDHQVHRIKAS